MAYLISPEWFTDLSQWWLLAIVVASVGVLIKGADWLVEGAAGLAYRAGIPKVIVGATVVSLGTTSPECAVSVMAAWGGNAELALGNAVGSIICNTGLIFALGCMMTVLPADRFVLRRQGWVKIGAGLLLAAVCYISLAQSGDAAQIGRPTGYVFLLLLVAYMAVSVKWSRQHPHGQPGIVAESDQAAIAAVTVDNQTIESRTPLLLVVMGVIGLILVIVASHVLICSVTVLADKHWGIPKVVIAATIVALGTSLPELVIGMASIAKGHKELLVGNIIGANILNVLFVIGASAIAKPLPIVEHAARLPHIFLIVHLPTMLIMLALFGLYTISATKRGQFRRWFGYPLLTCYVLFIAASLYLS